MRKTVGNIDSVIRIILAIVLMILIFVIPIPGVWAWIAGAVALALFITAVTGYCPLYSLFGLRTMKRQPEPPTE